MEPKEIFLDVFEDLLFASGLNTVPAEAVKKAISEPNFSFLYKYNFITEDEAKKLRSFAFNYNSVKTDLIIRIIKSVFERLNLTQEEEKEMMLKIKEDFERFIGTIKINQNTSYNAFIYVLSVINSIYETFNKVIIPSNITKLVSKTRGDLEQIYKTLNNVHTNPNNNGIVANENVILVSPLIEDKVNTYLIEKSAIYASYCLKKSNLFSDEIL